MKLGVVLKKSLCLVLLVLGLASATGLGGRRVILLVSESRSTDKTTLNIKRHLHLARTLQGLNKTTMPIVVMGFKDDSSGTPHFERLDLKAEDSPVLCVVEWDVREELGPKAIVDGAIIRRANQGDVDTILSAYFKTPKKRWI